MDNSLYFNQSGCHDPTMGYVLNKIEKEEKNRQKWLEAAKKLEHEKQTSASKKLIPA